MNKLLHIGPRLVRGLMLLGFVALKVQGWVRRPPVDAQSVPYLLVALGELLVAALLLRGGQPANLGAKVAIAGTLGAAVVTIALAEAHGTRRSCQCFGQTHDVYLSALLQGAILALAGLHLLLASDVRGPSVNK
ncbi:MAG: MauE/DoxX family redox-associated membrane protein [Candidatus Limnocylindrus sp.]